MQDKLIISIKIKKTIELVRKTTCNYSHEYKFLKDTIMNTFYDLLKLTYKANIYKDINVKKDMVVDIKMIEYYIKVSCDYQLISYKKFKRIGDYLLEINKMVYSWMNYEENR